MRWPFRSRRAATPTQPSSGMPAVEPARHDSAVSDAEVVQRLAAEHLPEGVRDEWLALLWPAVRLVPAADGEHCVARLGGLPDLPADIAWPSWPGHGPLSFIGNLDCGRLAPFNLDLPIPSSGRLLFFYFDGSYDNFATTVGTWDVATLQGAHVIHVGEGLPSSPRPAPGGVRVYPEQRYVGRTIMTAPGWEHPDLGDAFKSPGQDHRSFMEHPVNADAFLEALHERHSGQAHQVGGYADPVQGPVEHEVALAALNNEVPYGDPRLDEEARRWELLLQVDTDDDLGMLWGDCGALYWMARPTDLAAGNFNEISFTWQCS